MLRLADGRTVSGAIHGSGGIVAGASRVARVERAIRQANKGRDTGLYEPNPGHARLYRMYSNISRDVAGNEIEIDLRGAEVVR